MPSPMSLSDVKRGKKRKRGGNLGARGHYCSEISFRLSPQDLTILVALSAFRCLTLTPAKSHNLISTQTPSRCLPLYLSQTQLYQRLLQTSQISYRNLHRVEDRRLRSESRILHLLHLRYLLLRSLTMAKHTAHPADEYYQNTTTKCS